MPGLLQKELAVQLGDRKVRHTIGVGEGCGGVSDRGPWDGNPEGPKCTAGQEGFSQDTDKRGQLDSEEEESIREALWLGNMTM